MNLIDYLYAFVLKKGQKSYKATVKLDPLPENCYECPFYYAPNPDDAGWAGLVFKTCFLVNIEDSKGIALERYKDCPLRRE